LPKRIFLKEVCALMVEILQSGGEVALVPSGKSMLPLLRDRQDKIILVQAPEKLKKYDIPLYRRHNGQFVLHRIVAVKENGYVLCGDHQWEPEYGVRHDQVIAVVKAFYRGKKYIDCSNKAYRLYCLIWTRLFWVRKIFFRFQGLARRVRKSIS